MSTTQIVYDRTTIANVSMRVLQGSRGLGHGRVVVALDVHHTMHSGTQAVNHPRVVHFSGAIHDANGGLHVSDVQPKSLAWNASRSEDLVYLDVTLPPRTLDLLNDARKTPRDDINLSVRLVTTLDGAHGWEEGTAELRWRISASDWLTMLEGFGHSTMALIEIPVAGAVLPEGLQKAGDFLRRAVEKLGRCDWDGAIADTREVYDELRQVLGSSEPDVPWADFAQRPDREAWGFDQRLASVRMMVRNATHTAHHGGKDRGPPEARYIVGLAGLALKLYAERFRG